MIVDSSFLISFFTSDDVNHFQAIEISRKNPAQTFLVPDRVLEETLTAMIYKRGTLFALELFQELQENRRFIVRTTHEDEIQATFLRVRSTPKKISFIDYLVVELSLALQMPLASFDRQVNALYRRLQ